MTDVGEKRETSSLYLSRLVLDPRHRQVQRILASPYEMHRTVMQGFPENIDPTEHRVLFRVEDPIRYSSEPRVLVQSMVQPDWTPIRDHQWCHVAESKSFNPELEAGTRLTFRLRANPTVCRDGKRHGLFREESQIDWLRRKAEDSGFEVLRCLPIKEGNLVVKRAGSGDMTLFAVRYEGLLRVLDGGMLRQAVARGIGRGKGLGFGLLSLAPPS